MPLQVTFIGHATVLIEWDGFKVLTDPVFSSRVLCFKRLAPLTLDPSRLPRLDAILLSHAHYDHLDLFSYKFIPSDVPIVVPEGTGKALEGLVNNPVIELATWSKFSPGRQLDSHGQARGNLLSEQSEREGEAPTALPLEGATLAPIIEITAVPAKHMGGRFLIPCRYRTCHGYVISHRGEHLYFAGDTRYDTHFERIRSLFRIKLALLPLARGKLNGQELLKAWEDLGRPDVIPIHWGTFFDWQGGGTLPDDSIPASFHRLKPGENLTV